MTWLCLLQNRMIRSGLGRGLSVLSRNSLSIRSYHLYASGLGCHGALGDGITTEVTEENSPLRVESVKELDIVSADCGWGHSAVVTYDGNLYAFGRTHDMRNTVKVGRLWNKNPLLAKLMVNFGAFLSVDEPLPRHIEILDENHNRKTIAGVRCSAGTTAAITDDGQVCMFGSNRYGQCGIGNLDSFVWQPTQLKNVNESIVDVALGFQHGLALSRNGEVYVWGKGERGQLGNGITLEDKVQVRETPEKLSKDYFENEKVISVGAGFNSSLVLTENGNLFVWGKFQGIGLAAKGRQNHEDAIYPRKVEFLESCDVNISSIHCGHFYFLARDKSAGELWMWGMVPDNVSTEALKAKVGISNALDDSSKSIFKLLDTGVDRTVHNPFKVPIKLQKTDEIFAGYDRFYIKRSNGQVSRMDWSLIEVPITSQGPYPKFKSIHVGWKHMLLLAYE
mmetsp:Transcript_5702/g.7464  ORF Transcript_5702/g.7464 Transcript_5702/m.7464 type:complete len:450 (+) Transcript_5702:57-1406(+)